jgi:hypothetical protein
MTLDMRQNVNLSQFSAELLRKINNYVYEVPEEAIGSPMSPKAVADALAEMRAALIAPYWTTVEIRDTFDQMGAIDSLRRDCVAVADDGKGIMLLYDPDEKSFVLAQNGTHGLQTFGVRGDAVGCFLSR